MKTWPTKLNFWRGTDLRIPQYGA